MRIETERSKPTKCLFDAVDVSDGKKEGWIDTSLDLPHKDNVRTKAGQLYDTMQLDVQRNIARANMSGPHKSPEAPNGERYLNPTYDLQHVTDATEYLAQEGYRDEFLLQLANSRKQQTVSTSNSKDTSPERNNGLIIRSSLLYCVRLCEEKTMRGNM